MWPLIVSFILLVIARTYADNEINYVSIFAGIQAENLTQDAIQTRAEGGETTIRDIERMIQTMNNRIAKKTFRKFLMYQERSDVVSP